MDKQWNYYVKEFDLQLDRARLELELQALGHFGWELVAVDLRRYIFKRPRS
jgi:hypothetical protein